MQRSRLHNKILTGVNIFLEKSNKFCVSILRKRKRAIFLRSFKEKYITDSKTFWETVDNVLFDKVRLREKISLVENDRIHSDDDTVAKTLTIVT